MKRLCTVLVWLMLLLAVMPMKASANGPEPAPWFEFYCTNLPEGTVYVDLLISLPQDDPKYTELVEENLPQGIGADSQIVAYCEDGFRSYSFHYDDARSAIRVTKESGAFFFIDDLYHTEAAQTRYDHAEEIRSRGAVRLAMLDENGSILKVSDDLLLQPREFASYSTGYFRYDAATDTLEVSTGGSGIGLILYGVISLFGLFVTCLVEWIVAKFFKLTKVYGRTVFWTNVLSQLCMRVTHVALYSLLFWKYTYAVIFLEILVYSGEYLVYSWKMKDISRKKRIGYVLAANTASLILGLYMNRSILF